MTSHPESALHRAVQTAGNFLLSTTKYACDPRVKQALRFAKNLTSQVALNFDIINNAAPNLFQVIFKFVIKAPSFVTSREKICRLMVDRLTILNVSLNNDLSISPKFRYTISLLTPPCKINLLSTDDSGFLDLSSTPTTNNDIAKKPLASFINCTNINPQGKTKLSEENDVIRIKDPPGRNYKDITPQRPRREFKVRSTNLDNNRQKRILAHPSSNQRKKKIISNQKRITSFFDIIN
uniref:Uncharacterized protein n=1 Tax=Heterorhabditis bacteriophora TaxID=37862 RepID=A0A1I7WV24_HETBA